MKPNADTTAINEFKDQGICQVFCSLSALFLRIIQVYRTLNIIQNMPTVLHLKLLENCFPHYSCSDKFSIPLDGRRNYFLPQRGTKRKWWQDGTGSFRGKLPESTGRSLTFAQILVNKY